MRLMFGIYILASILINSPVHANDQKAPFGLSWGVNKMDLEKIGVILSDESPFAVGFTSFSLEKLPVEPSNTDVVQIVISTSHGLQKIAWASKDIEDDIYGSEGKEKYLFYKNILVEKYGAPKNEGNFVGTKKFLKRDEFYECLAYSGCGVWAAVWSGSYGSVVLQLKGLKRGSGYVSISYEGPRWADAVDAAKRKRSKSDRKAF